MRKTIKLFLPLFFLLLIFANQQLFATCIIDNTGMPQTGLFPTSGTLMGTISGQSFTACETNNLTSIQIETSGGNIDLYLVQGNRNTLITSPIYQSFASMPAGIITLNLSTPLAVNTGDLISFGIQGPAQIRLDINPPMAPVGGVDETLFFINSGTVTPQVNSDLFFKATITSTPESPIPTISQWGLLIFGLGILNLGVFFVQRKELI